MPVSVRTAYKRLLKKREIHSDEGQARAVEAFARLEGELDSLNDPWIPLPFFSRGKAPKGLYVWGPPGRGKSMLMDLFFDSAPVQKKRRTHFHVFMGEVHALIGAWREGDASARKKRFGTAKGDDPIAPVADLIARDARLLCFDELQVTDIADAMILGRLFEALFERRVVLVATSNRPPEDLYKNGINRQLFVPFIDMLKRRCEVVEVAGPKDFRLDRLKGAQVYFSPITAETSKAFDHLWRDMTRVTHEVGATIEVAGRRLEFPRACGAMLRASFEELCARPLGPQDYLAIAGRFQTVFLAGVPKLGPERRNEARRLVTLIDALYEAGTKLVVLAEGEPADLYPAGDGAFEFERTVSRLQEMRSADYVERAEA
ncbi:cell division protein ZapE [Caulobacter sp. 17J65-9]|uniref:cell division protein ZapE n=1 Tax=Caulobacter sp. 17J65-9 TaxID=2709382 RepID=UPI0013CCC996|nr:cell division protein ZapE [Caulobacter sp. 17J65-9]NEX92423.1 cell division protein ZapE [Caulobacter sp. 17J65-9]